VAVASVQDVADSLGRPITTTAEVVQVGKWLDDAEMQIRLRLGVVAALDQQALAFVEREAVILKIRNPEGKKSESIDDYQYSRYDSAARGQVWILDEWWDLLTPNSLGGAFTITPYSTTYMAEALNTTSVSDWDSIP
jgi:hypothetical protein